MAHLDFFGLENIRVFSQNEGFEFKPITILTGANSTGKSSLNKSLLLYAEIFKFGYLNFKETENLTQLGGFENTISKGSKNRKISFSFRFPIKNFPSLGDESYLFQELTFGRDGLESQKYFHDDELLIEITSEILSFKLEIFFEILHIPEIFEVKKLEEELIPSQVLANFQGSGKFGIINPTEKFGASVLKRNKGEYVNTIENLSFRPVYFSKDLEHILSLVDLYKTKFPDRGVVEQNLFYEFSSGYNTPWGDSETFTEREAFDSPLIELLVKEGLSKRIAKFIDEEIFISLFNSNRSKRNLTLNSLESLHEKIVYHQAAIERFKRVYLYGDSTLVLKRIEDIENDKSRGFINKWCSKDEFNLKGDLKLEFNDELAYWTIKIGDEHLSSLGQGIGQLITLLVNICSYTNKVFLVEEPETSLHPNFQSKLADFFIDAQRTFGHQFIIETHSEYLIRKLQYLIAKKEYKAGDAIIYNFRKATEDNPEVVKRIDINEDGSLNKNFYPGFFDEADNLAISLFNLNNKN